MVRSSGRKKAGREQMVGPPVAAVAHKSYAPSYRRGGDCVFDTVVDCSRHMLKEREGRDDVPATRHKNIISGAATVSSRRSCPGRSETVLASSKRSKAAPSVSSRPSRAVTVKADNRACNSGIQQKWHELGDSSSSETIRQQPQHSTLHTTSSLTSDCSSDETYVKSRKSIRSVFSKGSHSKKKSTNKSPIKTNSKMQPPTIVVDEEGENEDDSYMITRPRTIQIQNSSRDVQSNKHYAKKERGSTSRNRAKKQSDLEFWSDLAVHVAMAVMGAKGTEKMAQRASNMVLQEGQRRAGRECSREMMRSLSTKLSMAILEAGGDGKVASAVVVAVMMATDNSEDVVKSADSMLSDDNSTDPSIVPSVASTASVTPSDDSTPSLASNIQSEWLNSTGNGSITKSKASKPKKTSQANQSPCLEETVSVSSSVHSNTRALKRSQLESIEQELDEKKRLLESLEMGKTVSASSPTVSASSSVHSSTSASKRRQLESIQQEMEEKKRQLESLERDIENAKKRATEEAERLKQEEMNSSQPSDKTPIGPDRRKLESIQEEKEQRRLQLQFIEEEIAAKKKAAEEAVHLESMIMEIEQQKKAIEEEELRNQLALRIAMLESVANRALLERVSSINADKYEALEDAGSINAYEQLQHVRFDVGQQSDDNDKEIGGALQGLISFLPSFDFLCNGGSQVADSDTNTNYTKSWDNDKSWVQKTDEVVNIGVGVKKK
jgi:hypothetical protein